MWEDVMYLTLQDCIDMSDLTEEEILAIAEHEQIPEILAIELGSYLVHTPNGEKRIKRMILDDIKQASDEGDIQHAALLKSVLKQYVEHHAEVVK
jgi:S-ribosylhomocysteine lyase LuxS involved in autoinducer biosynthesis